MSQTLHLWNLPGWKVQPAVRSHLQRAYARFKPISHLFLCDAYICLALWEYRLCVLAGLCHICLIPVSLLSCRALLGNRKQMKCLVEMPCRRADCQPKTHPATKAAVSAQRICKHSYFLSTSSCFLQELQLSDRFSVLLGWETRDASLVNSAW